MREVKSKAAYKSGFFITLNVKILTVFQGLLFAEHRA